MLILASCREFDALDDWAVNLNHSDMPGAIQ
jgi:hypothetical protein